MYVLPKFRFVDNPPKLRCHSPKAENGELVTCQTAKNLKDELLGHSVDGAVVGVVHMGRYQGIHPGAPPSSQDEGHAVTNLLDCVDSSSCADGKLRR